jgi:hypothetical protein
MERSLRLERVQRVSAMARYLLIAASSILGIAVVMALFTPGQDWVSVGNGRFIELWHSQSSNRLALLAITAPIAFTLVLGVYWLQRLFGEYQAGRFFTDSCMRCYSWLVWLKAVSFVLGILWPYLLERSSNVAGTLGAPLTIDAGSFIELIVLLLIVHLLKEAQQLNDENQAFV